MKLSAKRCITVSLSVSMAGEELTSCQQINGALVGGPMMSIDDV